MIIWKQKIGDLWSHFGLDPLRGDRRAGAQRPDWRANAQPHRGQNYSPIVRSP